MMESDPLSTIGILDVVKRTHIPRSTITKWLAQDELDKRRGRSFPWPLSGRKLRWNERAMALWFERHHEGANKCAGQ